jgi:tetratricopeptide (TPR) repeat protein
MMHLELSALISLAENKRGAALRSLQQAVDIADNMGPPRGPATPVIPAHELYGEVLLDGGKYAEAIGAYEASLLRMPNRPAALLGLARAQSRAGDAQAAALSYRKLLDVRGAKENLEDVREARKFLAGR